MIPNAKSGNNFVSPYPRVGKAKSVSNASEKKASE